MEFLRKFLRKLLRNPLVGVVDARSARTLRGWARNRRNGAPVTVDFTVDGRIAGSTVADRYRADLVSESPYARCAFEYTIPAEYFDGTQQIIEVRARGGAKPLTGGRFAVRLHPARHYEELTREILRHGLWAMAGGIEDGMVHIGGWTISPPGSGGRITVNGEPVALGIREGAQDWKSPLPPGFASFAFEGDIPLDPRRTDMRFSFGAEQPFHPLRDHYYPLFAVAMPEPERRLRVAGHESEFLFNLEGYSVAKKLDALSQRFAGRPLADLGPVLDWGCGGGRTSRFLAHSGADLYGVDIDADNVRWCSDHIKGRFATIVPQPPTAFADNFFAAVCGISVFTHLTQDYEALWLAELHRIAQPGALLFLSVLGNVAAARDNLLEEIASDADGFIDVGRNPGIDAVTQGSAYYRNVFHQPGYIARVWGRHFEILSIEQGIVGNYQDLVVARKPA
jgi:SAM-dependent methyltransferase